MARRVVGKESHLQYRSTGRQYRAPGLTGQQPAFCAATDEDNDDGDAVVGEEVGVGVGSGDRRAAGFVVRATEEGPDGFPVLGVVGGRLPNGIQHKSLNLCCLMVILYYHE